MKPSRVAETDGAAAADAGPIQAVSGAADPKRSALIERFFSSRLRLSQLRLLVAIADHSQLSHVATLLNVTPPAVSKQLAEMEESLGIALMVRAGKQLKYTPVGALMARRAREVLAQLERTRVEVDALCAGVAGAVSIGVVPTAAALFVPGIVLGLKSRAPNANLQIHEHYFEHLAPMLADGVIDLALARETSHVSYPGFIEQAILTDPMSIVCGPDHWLLRKENLTWSDLDGVPWVMPIRGSPTHGHLESLLARRGLQVPLGSIESNYSVGSLARLLQLYPFVGLMSLSYARMEPHGYRTVALPLSTDGMQSQIKAVWREDDRNPLTRTLLEIIRGQAMEIQNAR